MNKIISHMFANLLNILHVLAFFGLFILHESLSQVYGDMVWLIILFVVFSYVFFVGFITTIITIKETLINIDDKLKELK